MLGKKVLRGLVLRGHMLRIIREVESKGIVLGKDLIQRFILKKE